MTSRSRKSATWQPTSQQREAARLLAASATWQMTADRVGVKSLQTIANWLEIPEFAALKAQYETQFDQYLESDITGSISEMFMLWRQFVRGEVSASDKRIARIAPTCTKYIERFYGVTDTPAGPQPSLPPINLTIDQRSQTAVLPQIPERSPRSE